MSSLGFSEKTAAAVRSCQGLGHSPWSMRASDFPCRGEPKVLPFCGAWALKTLRNHGKRCVDAMICACTRAFIQMYVHIIVQIKSFATNALPEGPTHESRSLLIRFAMRPPSRAWTPFQHFPTFLSSPDLAR